MEDKAGDLTTEMVAIRIHEVEDVQNGREIGRQMVMVQSHLDYMTRWIH